MSTSNVVHPVRVLRMRWIDRVGDALFRGLTRLGMGPAWTLTTRGRRTGQLRRTPVIPVSYRSRQWLVAPYGEVSWVRNARAAGQVQLSRGRRGRTYAIRHATVEEAGPVLQRYVQIARATRPYFAASVDAPVSAFIAEADRHPVFELTPVNDDQTHDGKRRTRQPGLP
jgi:deazaflavin-dependent oxidoreductase (nitroreductase family)